MPAPSRVADILMEQGRQAADAARAKGQIWGSTVQRLGEIPGEAVQQHQREQERQQAAKMRQQGIDIDAAHLQMMQGEQAAKAQEAVQNRAGDVFQAESVKQHTTIDPTTGHHATDHAGVAQDLTEHGFQKHAEHYMDFAPKQERMNNEIQTDWLALEDKKNKWLLNTFSDIPDAPEADRADLYTKRLASLPELARNYPAVKTMPPVYPGHAAMGNMVEGFRTDADRTARAKTAATEKLATSKETAAEAKAAATEAETAQFHRDTTAAATVAATERARHDRAVENRPPAAGAATGSSAGSDAEAIAGAIERGEQPPDVKGLYRNAGPVRAALARKGYDMTNANLDWQATQRHVATLNNSQQTRLRQSINTASESLDVIDDLAKKWDAGRFPILNKANLMAAKNGVYGKDAASIATQLDGQITDVTSELGNVYMGGNSPTDHALQLAGKNLSASWDRKVLLDMTKLARTNLRIRNNSMMNVGVAGARPDNIYAPPPVQPTGGSISVTAPDGSKHAFATQAQADTFKKLAGIK